MLKKEFMITVAAIMITLSFTGCQKNEDPNAKSNKEQSVAQAGEEKDKEEKVEEEPQFEVYLGRVKSIVGNEIELDLAKDKQFEQEAPEAPEEGEDGETAAVMMQPAQSSTPSGDESENIPGGAQEYKLELEYTGEVKSLVVPAGVTINSALGSDGKLTDIKEGAILQVIGSVDDKTLIIDNITILE